MTTETFTKTWFHDTRVEYNLLFREVSERLQFVVTCGKSVLSQKRKSSQGSKTKISTSLLLWASSIQDIHDHHYFSLAQINLQNKDWNHRYLTFDRSGLLIAWPVDMREFPWYEISFGSLLTFRFFFEVILFSPMNTKGHIYIYIYILKCEVKYLRYGNISLP